MVLIIIIRYYYYSMVITRKNSIYLCVNFIISLHCAIKYHVSNRTLCSGYQAKYLWT